MSEWSVWVDIDDLRIVGRDVAKVASALEEATTRVVAGLESAPRTVWTEAVRAAEEAKLDWRQDLSGLVARVDEFGTKLTTSADNYQLGDEQVVASMQRFERSLSAE